MENVSNIEDSMGETRKEISTLKQVNLSKKLNNHQKEVESKIDNIQAGILNLRRGEIVDNLSELEKRLEKKNKENVRSTLRESKSHLHKLGG
jgi:hypothetical protein